MQEIVQQIKQKGRQLGFSDIGICDAQPLHDAERLFQIWLNNQFHGTMEWMARTRKERPDPKSFFPEARSIVVTAHNYYRENEAILKPSDEANISIYARGRDYHKVVRKKLKRLLSFIEKLLPAAKGRVCVDSFPLLEKPLAVKAGIGWIGKHSNLIIRQKGSYYFLGEILLSVALPVDAPLTTEYCGTCTRCQDACPTGALAQAFVLDSRRCISYLTIEHNGDIDRQFHEGMGNWIFGCDICQAVCPWNRFSVHTAERDFDNRLPAQMYDLGELQQMNEDLFREIVEGTPIRRTGYKNLMRNIRIAAANAANRENRETQAS